MQGKLIAPTDKRIQELVGGLQLIEKDRSDNSILTRSYRRFG